MVKAETAGLVLSACINQLQPIAWTGISLTYSETEYTLQLPRKHCCLVASAVACSETHGTFDTNK